MEVKIDPQWKKVLQKEFSANYFQQIPHHLRTEKSQGKIIYPPGSQIFNAFDTTPFDKVKVVILGQDPYHGPGQANGLCFSVKKNIRIPPSLINIFKELKDDIGLSIPSHGDLTHWAQQGVFLLNASLTVRAGEPMSHAQIGWTQFTDAVIRTISMQKENIVFLLWGRFAQNKITLIDTTKHFVLQAAHPSPLSAHNGFLGCRHFSKTNEYLVGHKIEPIDWTI
ncbi:MAG TPA: uracil-DNA glycosylase [Chitinophagaceae bacterium]|nr:uracil-DNA glycosylase [Chitinophagaceae bacterium]